MSQRSYIDFKLYLTAAPYGRGACQVALLPTPEVGETLVPVTVPDSECPDEQSLWLLAARKCSFRSMVALGKALANCMLPDGIIRSRFLAAYDQSGPEGGVRLRLIIADHTLKTWPWEYAFFDILGGPESRSMLGFLALNPRISIVRHEPLPFPHPLLKKTAGEMKEIRMAFASAQPENQRKLALEEDLKLIKASLKGFNVDGVRLKLKPVLTDATPEDISQIPRGTHIFHFSGHGLPETEDSVAGSQSGAALLLVTDRQSKQEARLHASELAAELQEAGVRLAVMSACNSGQRSDEEGATRSHWDGIASALAAREIPAIIGMQYPVLDASAKAFNRAFYGALASGLSLDESMSVGRRAMLRETSTNPDLEQVVDVQWGVPVLYSRLPDGQLFPERMQRAGEAAEAFRLVIQQTVNDVMAGKMTGIRVPELQGSVKVEQGIGILKGKVIGVDAVKLGKGARVVVTQTADTVGKDGEITGYQG